MFAGIVGEHVRGDVVAERLLYGKKMWGTIGMKEGMFGGEKSNVLGLIADLLP